MVNCHTVLQILNSSLNIYAKFHISILGYNIVKSNHKNDKTLNIIVHQVETIK